MKRKSLLFLLLMAVFAPWAAQAQQTHTVYENGTGTNNYIPVYGYSGDTQGCTSEFIIPATDLNDIAGGTISGLTFYVETAAGAAWTATFNVYMKEVEGTTLSSNYGPNACTVVYTGALDATGTTMTVTFDQNYTYEGGNLLIGTYIVASGNWKDAVFSGISAEGAAYQSGGYQGEQGSQNFIPTTTFTYTPDPNYCGKPANVHIVENTLGPREVAIEWDAEDGELFEYSMQGTSYFDPNNIYWSDASTSHYEEWDQLTPDTDYTFCVRKKCGTDSYSKPVFLEFRTTVACSAPTLALTANSETAHGATLNWTGFSDSYILQMGSFVSSQPQTIYSEGFEGGSMPTGWTSEGTSWTVGKGDYSSSTTHTGSYNAKPSSSSSGSGNTGYLVTPVMNLNSYSNAKLSCWYMNHSWGGDTDAFGVYYRTSSTGTWNELFSTNSAHTSWTQTDELTLPSEAYVQIGFKYTDNYGYGVAVDDIEITADVVTYEWITFDNNATSPYTFTTLLPETTYNVRVIGNCGSDGQSQPSNMVSFTTLASCPVPTALNVPETTITAHEATLLWTADNDSYNIRLGEVSYLVNADFETGDFSQANFINGTHAWSVVANDHSGAYCAKSASGNNSATSALELSVTLENDLTLTFSAKVSSEANYDKAYFYIDSEAKINGISGTGNWIDYSFPLTAGTHTLSWRYTKDSSVAAGDDCFYVDDIQVVNGSSLIDTYTSNTTSYNFTGLAAETTYSVQVQGVCSGEPTDWSEAISFTTLIACPAPTNLVYDNVTKNSVELSWTETGGATEWEICINGDEENLVGVMENPYTLDRLDPQTDYTVKVRAVCGGEDGESAWSNTISFTTVVACLAPTNLVAGTPGTREVELSWTENGEATEWEICVNGDTENLIGVTENPYTLNRLDPETDYTVKVRAVCGGDDGESQWSNTVSFTTPEACAKPTNLATTDVTVNSIALTWDGTNDSYEVRYIESTSTADFEEGMGAWTTIDADGDGFTWLWSGTTTGVSGNNGSSYAAYSQSYDNDGDQVLYPDNYLVSPKVLLGGSITFYACAQDASWAAEHFGVAVSTTGNTDAADFTTIQEWTMNSDGTGTPGAKTQGTWGKFTVDLSAYSGEGYVAIRHFNCSDKFYIDVDDITINMPESAPWQYVDGITENTYTIENLTGNTSYAIQVRGYCQGEADPSNWTEVIYASTINGNVFITEGNWNVDGNWRGGVVPPAGCDVVIEANVTVPAGYVADAGRITVEGNAEITVADGGQLKTTFGGVIATMRKSINGYGTSEGGYILLANPVKADQNPMYLGLTDGEFDLYAFDQIEADEWRNYETSAFNLVNGQGYLYANEDDVDLAFTGELYPTNANIKVTMNYVDGVKFPGYNLFGNPYSCNAYIADGRAFYVMNSDGDEIIPANTNAIAPMQGVFVVATAIGNLNFTSVEPEQVNQTLNINLTSQSALIDRAVINFNEGESLRKFQLNPNHTKVYIPQDNDYAVVYTEDNVGEMPVSFKAEKNGTYSLSFNSQEVTFSYLHLIDNMTGNDVNLLETPSYTFNASTTDYASRFRLVFATGSSVDGENFGFVNAAGNLCIFGIEGEATVQVVDMMGRVLSSETFSGSYEKSINAAPGVYMLRLIQGNDVKVQKIVVR